MSGQKRRDSQGQGGIRPFQAVKNPFDRFIAFWAVFRSHRTCCRESARLAMGETLSKYDFMTNDAFQSTRPSRGETPVKLRKTASQKISIHSPLAGRDTARSWLMTITRKHFNPLAPRGARHAAICSHPTAVAHFNPLAPRGARRAAGRAVYTGLQFQSTRPSRGETVRGDAGHACGF